MLCMKRVYAKIKRRWSTGQQPGTKSASCPAVAPVINRSSTARCVPPSIYIGFRLFVLLERRSGDVYSMPWGVRGTLVSLANCFVGVQSCPAPLRLSAVRPDPTRPWCFRVLDSTGYMFSVFVKRVERVESQNKYFAGDSRLGAARCFALL